MNSDNILTPYEITLVVRGMKHSIVQVLADYEGKIAENIRLTTVKYLDDFDFEVIVKQEVERTVRGFIQSKIQDLVWKAVNDATAKASQKIIDNMMKKL